MSSRSLGKGMLLFYDVSATMALYKTAPFSRLLRHVGDTEDVFST